MGLDRFGVATNSSRIDAKRGDNFLQADFWPGITSEFAVIREEPAALRRASPECDSTRCFADCRFEPAESAPGNPLPRKLTYYLRLFCIRPVRALGKSASTPSR